LLTLIEIYYLSVFTSVLSKIFNNLFTYNMTGPKKADWNVFCLKDTKITVNSFCK